MARFPILAAVVASLSSATAQFSPADLNDCLAAGFNSLQCSLCGFAASQDYKCAAYNATFIEDGLSDGAPLGVYKNAAWTGFTRITQGPGEIQPLAPSVGMTYGAIAPGSTGTLDFGYYDGVAPLYTGNLFHSGSLRYFHYACASPDGTNSPVPVPCQITVTGTCLANGATDLANGPFAPLNAVLNYNPASLNRADLSTISGMAYQAADFAMSFGQGQGLATPQRCANYTFSAVGTAVPAIGPLGTAVIPGGLSAPGPVVLFDEMLYTIFVNQPAAASP